MFYKNINNKFNFVVAGGGTAGWLTALFIKKHFTSSNVTVIESSEIGILGAGEGATPHFVDFLEDLDISPKLLFEEADATIKLGVKFTNWNGDGSSYFHGFKNSDNLSHFFSFFNSKHPLLDLDSITNGIPVCDLSIGKLCSDHDTIPFVYKINSVDNPNSKFYHFEQHSAYSLHFNAVKVAKLFKKIGLERGINVIDGKIENSHVDGNNHIVGLDVNGQKINCDFVFDCTGFRKLFIGDTYKSNWDSYSDKITNNSAFPFFLKPTKAIPPYTESIAMKNGWIWKIPLQTRYGCGYVFDNTETTIDEVKREIFELFGTDVEFPRQEPFKFSAGCFKQTWVGNCISIGLSGNFIEPLEATSIYVSILSLKYFLNCVNGVVLNDEYFKEKYNNRVSKINQEIVDFVLLHYITKRRDTNYWVKMSSKRTPSLEKFFEECEITIPDEDFFVEKIPFSTLSWFEVGSGLGHFKKEIANSLLNGYLQGNRKEPFLSFKSRYVDNLFNSLNLFVRHHSFIDYIKSK